MQRLTDEIFNTYVQKGSGAEPYYTEYCDGRSVSCSGMKQWGTVTLANQGYTPLQILRYYYGSNVSIRTTGNIAAIPESYPGYSLRRGDTGTNVSILQRQLNRIARDYPSFGTLEVDGIFGSSMETTVKRFQRQFGLTADGVVGRSTWYKISYIYASVKRLAQLTSEGDDGNSLDGGAWGGTALRQGSTGTAVERVQFWLNTLAQFDSTIPSPAVDGVFGSGTTAAVTAFQRRYGLVADGIVGRSTWDLLYSAYQSAQDDINRNAYPGSPLGLGSEGSNVKQIQFWMRIIARNYIALEGVAVDGMYGPATRQAVMSFQDYFGLSADGIVGEQTWNRLYTLYLNTINGLLAPNKRPGTFPGTLRRGSTGTAVRELQYYLYILGSYYPTLGYVAIDGNFGARTEDAVQLWQSMNGLTVDGVVGQRTWNSLASRANALRVVKPAELVGQAAWPGETLEIGCTGPAVAYINRLLNIAAFWDPNVQSADTGEEYTAETAAAVESFQRAVGLDVSGTVTRATWDTLEMTVSALLQQKEG